MGYQETPLTLIEITLFILVVGDCLCACARHNLPHYTLIGINLFGIVFTFLPFSQTRRCSQ